METPEGIDLEGTGPDTPLPTSDAYETYRRADRAADAGRGRPGGPRPDAAAADPDAAAAHSPPAPPAPAPRAGRPAGGEHLSPTDLPAAETAAPGGAGADRRAGSAVGRAGPTSVARSRGRARSALLAALLIPLLAASADRWNVFAVLSPFEAVGVAAATWAVVRASGGSAAVAAGALSGFGAPDAGRGARAAQVRGRAPRMRCRRCSPSSSLAAGAAILARRRPLPAFRSAGRRTARRRPGPLVLGLAGAALAVVALFVDYDGFSSLWNEVAKARAPSSSSSRPSPSRPLLAGVVAARRAAAVRRRAAARGRDGRGAALRRRHRRGVARDRRGRETSALPATSGSSAGLLILAAGAWARRGARS